MLQYFDQHGAEYIAAFQDILRFAGNCPHPYQLDNGAAPSSNMYKRPVINGTFNRTGNNDPARQVPGALSNLRCGYLHLANPACDYLTVTVRVCYQQ